MNKQEMINMFLETLTDIYNVKKHLLTYLPEMAKKSSFTSLRLSILNASIDIKSQIMRLEMVLAILQGESVKPVIIKEGDLRLDDYVASTLKKSEAYKTNIAIISHFVMLESIQITSFELLRKMSRSIRNPTIKDLIEQNLRESQKNKKVFYGLLTDYIF